MSRGSQLTLLAGVLLLVLGAGKRPAGLLDVTDVRVFDHPNHTRVVVELSGSARYHTGTLEDPARFAKGREVGPALGLVPRRDQSGDRDPQLSITKTGNAFLRRLLVGSAHYVLGPFGPDCDLRRWGLQLAERGGKNAKKRAVVAVARKLAVLLHRLWKNGELYEPLYRSRQHPSATVVVSAVI